ncbi:TNF receptor-associated factor 2-like isoform X6 [Ptychodera flava]|uniref:TNF receptor-associated factor 2-like isoform X6 n=1 Tax=Ptychodera flava TaxID=63121 RepID=UPI00396A316A
MESCLLSLNKVYSDKAILRELNELSVQCPNDSCPWIGDYKQYDQDHHRTCPLEQISCIKAGCEMIVRRIQLTEHLENDCKFRVVKCQYCRVEFTQKELEAHFETCSEYQQTGEFCEKNARVRRKMKDQRNAERDVCGKKVVACKFKDVGCNVQVTLMWIDQNDKEHVIDAFRPDPTSSSFRRPTQDMNIASGCPLFMPLSQLGSLRNAYVKDDVAFLKVIVDKCDLI